MANPNPPDNSRYLTPYKKGEERAKINGSKGGIAARESRKRAQTFKAVLELLLDEVQENGKTRRENISDALLLVAESGNVEAFKALRDSVGEKPVDNLSVQGTVNNPLDGLTTEELRALANVKPKRKRGRPKKTDDGA